MQINTDEKNLVKREESVGFFGRIRSFFKNLFSKKETIIITNGIETEEDQKVENKKQGFKQTIKYESCVEADHELLELQQKLINGDIKIKDLTDEQEDQLIDLYDKQIAVKKARIEELKKKLEKIEKRKKAS